MSTPVKGVYHSKTNNILVTVISIYLSRLQERDKLSTCQVLLS